MAGRYALTATPAVLRQRFGYADEAGRVSAAVAAEVAGRTPGAPLRTDEVGDRVAAAL